MNGTEKVIPHTSGAVVVLQLCDQPGLSARLSFPPIPKLLNHTTLQQNRAGKMPALQLA